MTFASDKLYKGYLRRNMPTIVSKVKVREIIPHLPCLTDHDRENIEAKRETYGNYDSMVLLLDCLKRRQNWPEEFITALEACDHPTIADEIRKEYNALRPTNNSNPSSPSATVIRAHVHPAPSASHVSITESDGCKQATVAPPAEATAPPEPASEASSPLEIPVQPEAPHGSAAMAPEDASPPEPVTEPLQSVQIEVVPAPSTPPPSPETPYTQGARTSPPPQKEIQSHQEPVENSESDIQVIPGDNEFVPAQASAGNGEVNSVNTPPPSDPVEQCETEAPSQQDALQTTKSTEVRPPQSASPTHNTNSNVITGSTLHVMTPEKPPIQDTTPPVEFKPAAALQPEETSEPPATQVVGSSPQRETAASASVLPGAAGMDTSLFDNTLCLSKPGDLISVQPQNHGSPTNPAPGSPVEPYSGTSERLEISSAAVTSAYVPACSIVSSASVNTTSALPCQENGIGLKPNEPEENHYESPGQSLETQEIRVNVVQVSEEPSILNLDGQSSTPEAQMINGEPAKEIVSEPPLSASASNAVPSVNTPSSENYHPFKAAPASPELKTLKEEKTSSCMLTTNTKYILTAVGVGTCALLMAWKFKN